MHLVLFLLNVNTRVLPQDTVGLRQSHYGVSSSPEVNVHTHYPQTVGLNFLDTCPSSFFPRHLPQHVATLSICQVEFKIFLQEPQESVISWSGGNDNTVHSGMFMFVMVMEEAMSDQVSQHRWMIRLACLAKHPCSRKDRRNEERNDSTKEQ